MSEAMTGDDRGLPREAGDLNRNAEEVLRGSTLPAVVAGNERKVRASFWKKLRRFAGRIPFTRDLVAAYYCALDPATPMRVKGILLAALAYFILPIDLVPDFLLTFGFTDDATVLATAIAMVRGHMKQAHWEAAERALDPDDEEVAA